MNKMVKMIMSQRTFLGMQPPPLDYPHLSRAVDRNPSVLSLTIISMRGGTGENFSRFKIIS
jgi:hypothetical protein